MYIKKILKLITIFIFVVFFALPVFAQQGQPTNGTNTTGGQPTNGTNTTVVSQPDKGKVIKLTNPLGDNTNDVPTLVEKLLEIVLQVGVPLVAIAIIYTGYLFVAAQGAPDKLTKAKQSLMYVLIGAGILLGAYAIAQALVSTVNAIRG